MVDTRVAARFVFLLIINSLLKGVFIAAADLGPCLWFWSLELLRYGKGLLGLFDGGLGPWDLFLGEALQLHFDKRLGRLVLVL